MIRRALLSVLCLLATSCSADAPSTTFTVRDSAGVRIVENRAPAWDAGDAWRIDTVPLVDIGADDSRPGHDLARVRGVVRLEDGRIAVANQGSRQIRFYASDGTFQGSAGRSGEGPGEFRYLNLLVALPADSLLVGDQGLARLTVLRPDGSLVRTAQLDPPGNMPSALLADGTLLALPVRMFGAGSAAGAHQDSVTFVRYHTDGSLADTIGRFPGPPFFIFSEGSAMAIGPLLFSAEPLHAAAGDGFVFTRADRFEHELRDGSGRLTALIRISGERLRVTDEHVRRDVAATEERDDAFGAMYRRMVQAMPVPAEFPAWEAVLPDREGYQWLRAFHFYLDSLPQVWHVFDSTGTWLGPLTLPPRFDLRQIGAHEVLGVWRDEYDVEHVRAYPLHRN